MEDKELLQAISQMIKEEVKDIIAPLESDMKDMKSDMKDVKERLTSVENKIVTIDSRLTNLEDKIVTMDGRLTNLEDKVTMTNLIIENDVSRGIKLLVEGHQGLWDKIDNVEKVVEEMSPTVLALDILHIEDFQRLGRKEQA